MRDMITSMVKDNEECMEEIEDKISIFVESFQTKIKKDN
jgi:hypothetical protein